VTLQAIRVLGSVAICYLAVTVEGHEIITCKSPDKKFGLRCVYADSQPYNGETTIIDLATHQNIFSLNTNWTLGEVKLVWSPDSQCAAYFAENANGYSTRVFLRNGSSFKEMALPELPTPKLPASATGSEPDTNTRVEALRWTGANDLLLEKELINPAWGRTALTITLGFNQGKPSTVQNAEQEKVSIIDYFLLLPANNFEAPPSAWLRKMRTNGEFFLCDSKPNNIDEKNGYMSCAGDGAQASFEVALFRHRDGRPLIALCSGELEGDDSVFLTFFEQGTEGKMQEIKHSMFTGSEKNFDAEMGEGKGNWRFVLPREGKTITVRAPKSKKVLHKFTWDGDKFKE